MATINGVEVIGDKNAHDFDLLDKNDGINLANGVERNREATEDNHEDIVRHRTDTDVHVTPEWKNSLVKKETLGLYWTAAQTADIINEISIAGGAKLVKVDALPATGLEQTIYLVPKTDPKQGDIFDEYVWIDGKFEFIGTTKVDLSNYATKTELNAKANASDLSNYATKTELNAKANASDLSNYLPLSGGQMTGTTISRLVNTNLLQVCGGKSTDEGATIRLYGQNAGAEAGNFYIYTNDGNSSCTLLGMPSGGLYWGGKSIDVIEEQGDGYIRYSSGLQICWGAAQGEATGTMAYPKPFKLNTRVCVVGSYIGGDASKILCFVDKRDGVNVEYEKSPYIWADYLAIGKWK